MRSDENHTDEGESYVRSAKTQHVDENAAIIEQATSMFNPAGAQRAVYQSVQKTTYFNIR